MSLVWVLQGDGVQEEKEEAGREILSLGRSDPSAGGEEPADPLFDCGFPPQLGVSVGGRCELDVRQARTQAPARGSQAFQLSPALFLPAP